MRGALILWIVAGIGCAPGFVVVPDSEWQTVPAAKRDAIAQANVAERARLEAERDVAQTALEKVRRAPPPRLNAPTRATAAPGDEWGASIATYERDKQAAVGAIDLANKTLRIAQLAYYESRVALADASLIVLKSKYEVERARAVDRARLGTDTYDASDFRGQLADVQQQWYVAHTRMGSARDELTRASTQLVLAKQAYAQIVRGGPQAPTVDTRLRLADWNDRPLRIKGWKRTTVATDSSYLRRPRTSR